MLIIVIVLPMLMSPKFARRWTVSRHWRTDGAFESVPAIAFILNSVIAFVIAIVVVSNDQRRRRSHGHRRRHPCYGCDHRGRRQSHRFHGRDHFLVWSRRGTAAWMRIILPVLEQRIKTIDVTTLGFSFVSGPRKVHAIKAFFSIPHLVLKKNFRQLPTSEHRNV